MLPRSIKIGYQGQKNSRSIKIDISSLYEEFGANLVPTLVHKRQGDTSSYPVSNVTLSNKVLTWKFSAVDTAKPGYGECRIHMCSADGTVIGKSKIIETITGRDFSNGSTVPDAYEDWVDEIIAEASAIKGMTVEAESVDSDEEASVLYSNGTMSFKIPKGQKGDKGDTGAKGDKGQKGDQGVQGIQGLKGEKGDTGEQGPKGQTGNAGPQGAKGEKGQKGDSFTYSDFTTEQLAALKGPKGDTGQKGQTGSQGLKGDKGQKGDQGIQGLKGDKGDTGQTGATGPQGPKGDTGAAGQNGSNGLSADLIQNPDDEYEGIFVGQTDAVIDPTLSVSGGAADAKTVGDSLKTKIDKPSNTAVAGKVLKIKSVNADGTFVCEWADDGSVNALKGSIDLSKGETIPKGGLSTDVQINGTSIVQNGVAKIDNIVGGGLAVNSNKIVIDKATTEQITSRNGTRNPICPSTLNASVTAALSDANHLTMTDTQKDAACEVIGAERNQKFELIDTIVLDGTETSITKVVDLTAMRLFINNVLPSDNSSYKLMRITTKCLNVVLPSLYNDTWKTQGFSLFDVYQRYGFWQGMRNVATSIGAYNGSYMLSTINTRMISVDDCPKITSIDITFNVEPVSGGIIKIYGIRA